MTYERLGIPPLINAAGHLTIFGGSRMRDEVVEAMSEAARSNVSLNLLLERAGDRIAEIVGAEAAFITSGSAAGLVVSVAACMVGDDDYLLRRLPATQGLKNKVIMQVMQRNYYELMLRLPGAEIVEVGMANGKFHWPFPPWHLERELDERTAAVVEFPVYATENSLPLEQVIEIAQAKSVPVIVDAADEYPPLDNLRRYPRMGADLTIVSGGKGLRGPQSTGVVFGSKALVGACRANSNPIHGVGRPMKVGKEEILGLLAAFEVAADEVRVSEEMEANSARQQRLLDAWGDVPGVNVTAEWSHAGLPRVHVDTSELGGARTEKLVDWMAIGEPGVMVDRTRSGFAVHVYCIDDAQCEFTRGRLLAFFVR